MTSRRVRSLARRIRVWCRDHGSRGELAEKVGVSRYAIYSVCYGRFWGATARKLLLFLDKAGIE